MQESNIYFATNTFNYGGEIRGESKNRFKEDKADAEFFHQVLDYDALIRLKKIHVCIMG
ncbi:hypothetical protein CIY_14000 [Butyrivibrio fibrisolvens 16/4]|nr:hypothetical protein CIY_14000 [Butyrivibrio fibrisolvens 16/4]